MFSDSSDFINYDAKTSYDAVASGDYYIKVTNGGLLSGSPSLYPAGSVDYGSSNPLIDNVSYYLLIVTINDQTALLPSSSDPTLADNARCEATDTFSAFPDHTSGSASSSGSGGGGSSSSSSSGGGCGVVQAIGGGGAGGGNGPGKGGMNALFSVWGIALMLGLARLTQRLAMRNFDR